MCWTQSYKRFFVYTIDQFLTHVQKLVSRTIPSHMWHIEMLIRQHESCSVQFYFFWEVWEVRKSVSLWFDHSETDPLGSQLCMLIQSISTMRPWGERWACKWVFSVMAPDSCWSFIGFAKIVAAVQELVLDDLRRQPAWCDGPGLGGYMWSISVSWIYCQILWNAFRSWLIEEKQTFNAQAVVDIPAVP